jgi:hypothetical protein
MKDLQKLKDFVLEKIDFTKVLLDYNVDFMYDPRKFDETQLRCPFHGKDNKPSARFYRETQSLFCWVCYKRWDVVAFVMEKENINFSYALKFLIKRYKLDVSSIPDEPEFKASKLEPVTSDLFEDFLKGSINDDFFNVEKKIVESDIRSFKNKLEFKRYNALCTAFYMIMYSHYRGLDVVESLNKLKEKIRGIKCH